LIPVICYKDGEFINSNGPLELIKISLIAYKISKTKNSYIQNKFLFSNVKTNKLSRKTDFSFSTLDDDSLRFFNDHSEYIGTIQIEQFEKHLPPLTNLEENLFFQKNNQFLLKEDQYSCPRKELLRHNFLIKSYGHLRQENNLVDQSVPALFLNHNHLFTLNSTENSLKIGDLYKKELEIDKLQEKNHYKTLELSNLIYENSKLKQEVKEVKNLYDESIKFKSKFEIKISS
jgi:outer membrane receptor for Fe3+-dicitrate